MNEIETADMRPHTLEQGQLTANSESLDDLLSLPFTLGPPSLCVVLGLYSVLQEHSKMPTESAAATSYISNCAHFVGPEADETGRLDTHTTATSSIPQSISLNSFRNRTF